MSDTKNVILEMLREQVGLDDEAIATLAEKGRLNELTAVDSLLMVDLVVSLEDRFGIRFDPEDIDAELISDIARLAAFVDANREGE